MSTHFLRESRTKLFIFSHLTKRKNMLYNIRTEKKDGAQHYARHPEQSKLTCLLFNEFLTFLFVISLCKGCVVVQISG